MSISKETALLILITIAIVAVRTLKVLEVAMLTNVIITKMIVKILTVKIGNFVLALTLQIYDLLRNIRDKNSTRALQKCKETKSRKFNNSSKDFSSLLGDISSRNRNRIKIGHLNINSIRNKFDLLDPAVVENLHILLITKTKIDSSFPEAPFKIDGFTTTYRVDRDCHGGGLLLDIPIYIIHQS